MGAILAWIAIPASAVALLLAQEVQTEHGLSVYTMGVQGVALAALIWAIRHLLSVTLPEKDRQTALLADRFTGALDGMAERHERWETARHEDSESLRETLTQVRENCVKVQAGLATRYRSRDDGDGPRA